MSDPLPPLSSELTVPYFARTFGHLWRRFEQSPKMVGDYRALWEGVRTVNLLSTIATDGVTGCYAGIVCGNEMARVNDFIRDRIGIDPFEGWTWK